MLTRADKGVKLDGDGSSNNNNNSSISYLYQTLMSECVRVSRELDFVDAHNHKAKNLQTAVQPVVVFNDDLRDSYVVQSCGLSDLIPYVL